MELYINVMELLAVYKEPMSIVDWINLIIQVSSPMQF